MFKTLIFILLLLAGILLLFVGIKKKKALGLALICALIAFKLLLLSQALVATPNIEGDKAISELIQVELNGRKEWISLRGKDASKPVLLFLAGGPGGSQLGAVRRHLAPLEDAFVLVNWEQAGSGKSYDAADIDTLSPQTYIDDGLALTNYLKKRFNKDKIYLMGESWGSALGIFLLDQAPDSYHAFIGTGQMVDFEETERICFDKAMDLALARNDTKQIDALKDLGKPPYKEGNVAMKSATYLQYLSQTMAENPMITNAGYETWADLASKEYGIMDQVNFFRGIITTFSQVYPQLYDIDLRESYRQVQVPVYFFIGRHDLNAPPSLAKDYYKQVQAPEKDFIWFEHSGHTPWINEPQRFCEETIAKFLGE